MIDTKLTVEEENTLLQQKIKDFESKIVRRVDGISIKDDALFDKWEVLRLTNIVLGYIQVGR